MNIKNTVRGQHTHDLKELGQKIMEDGQKEQFRHVAIAFACLVATMIGAQTYYPEFTVPSVIVMTAIFIIYEIKSFEIVNHASLAILAGIVESFKKEALDRDESLLD